LTQHHLCRRLHVQPPRRQHRRQAAAQL
jgi:hypothetical protein